jgi:hypothetical protein
MDNMSYMLTEAMSYTAKLNKTGSAK